MDLDVDENVIDSDLESKKVLSVVVRTLRDRCCLLQQRLKSVEKENMRLTIESAKSTSSSQPQDIGDLIEKIALLNNEKTQLAHHVFMVACENKKLWTRLVNIGKLSKNQETQDAENCNKRFRLIQISANENTSVGPSKDTNFTVPHLIRSQTFTTSPNPKLKPRIEESDDNLEASLEEISLKVFSSFLAEKNELVQQYEQMVEFQMDPDLNFKSIGFAYLDDLTCDSLADIKHHTDKLMELKKEVSQQQIELKNIIAHLETIKTDESPTGLDGNKSTAEIYKLINKSECMDTSETEMLDSSTRWATPANSTSYHDNIEDTSSFHNMSQITQSSINNNKNIDNTILIPDKLNTDKICPLCGVKFNASVYFDSFTRHVEEHFIGDEE